MGGGSEQSLYHPTDLPRDDRWPDYGHRVSTQLGWRSMLSYRLSYRLSNQLMGDKMIAGLNIYADRPAAFDDTALRIELLLATHGALLLAAQLNRERGGNLERALDNSRDIGVAMGVLTNRHKLSREQAFDLLRVASQNTNRKVSEIAVEVGDTGTLELDPPARRTDRD